MLLWLTVTAFTQADENMLANGDFGDSDSGRPGKWTLKVESATVSAEQVGGRWYPNAFTFNSGMHDRIRIGFYMAPGANGSVWIDNIHSQPPLTIVNPSFEDVDDKGSFIGWTMTNPGTLSAATDRAFTGARSLLIKYKAAEPHPSRIIQYVKVMPNTNYKISFDVYLGDDFLGALRPNIYAGIPSHPHITGPDWNADDIVSERGTFGTRVGIDLAGGTAQLSQTVNVHPNRNLEFSAALRSSGLRGRVRLEVSDQQSDKVLRFVEMSKADSDWSKLRFRFRSKSNGVLVKLIGKGNGSIKIADARLEDPMLVPPAQKVEWLDASNDFPLSGELTVSVHGIDTAERCNPTGDSRENNPTARAVPRPGKANPGATIDKALEMLSEIAGDLRRLNATNGKIRISIGATYQGNRGYTLIVNRDGIHIKSASEKGAFHGIMTLMQLIERDADGKQRVLSCRMTDWPDMPVRAVALTGGSITGDVVKDLFVMAKMKFNTAIITMDTYGYKNSAKARDRIQTCFELGHQLGIDIIPLQTTLGWGHYVLRTNPNLAEGKWVQNEKVTLTGTKPVELAHRNVIRTQLTDIVVTSADGKRKYEAGVDYRVIPGETKFENNMFHENARPFSVARVASGAIPDEATVLANYDYVGPSGKRRYAYCALEPQVVQMMGDWIEGFARDWPFSGNFICNDELHGRFYTDSRCRNCGRSPSQVLSQHLHVLNERAKKGRPDFHLWMWGDMVDPHDAAKGIEVEDIGPMLPKDIRQVVWGYSANVPKARGLDSVKYFATHGISTVTCGWYNTNNIRQWVQVVRKAREQNLPCLGYVACVWHDRREGLEESAICSWRIPEPGERRYEPID
jgi:hypothetical protein